MNELRGNVLAEGCNANCNQGRACNCARKASRPEQMLASFLNLTGVSDAGWYVVQCVTWAAGVACIVIVSLTA
jgi:hypothetical protein